MTDRYSACGPSVNVLSTCVLIAWRDRGVKNISLDCGHTTWRSEVDIFNCSVYFYEFMKSGVDFMRQSTAWPVHYSTGKVEIVYLIFVGFRW